MELTVLGKDKRLYFQKSVRINGKPTKKTIEYLGKLDDLIASGIEDPISYYKAEAKRRTEEEKLLRENKTKEDTPKLMSIPADFSKHYLTPKYKETRNNFTLDNTYFYGQFPLLYSYSLLELDQYFLNRKETLGKGFDSAIKTLIFSKILNSDLTYSLSTLADKIFFSSLKMNEKEIKNGLETIYNRKEELISWINLKREKSLKVDTSTLFSYLFSLNMFYDENPNLKRKHILKNEKVFILISFSSTFMPISCKFLSLSNLEEDVSLSLKDLNKTYKPNNSYLIYLNENESSINLEETIEINKLSENEETFVNSNSDFHSYNNEFLYLEDYRECPKLYLWKMGRENSFFLLKSNIQGSSSKNDLPLFPDEKTYSKLDVAECLKHFELVTSLKLFFSHNSSLFPSSSYKEALGNDVINYISFSLLSILKLKLKGRYQEKEISLSLKKAKLDKVNDAYFHNLYFDDILESLKNSLQLEINKEFYTKQEIVMLRSQAKKQEEKT